MRMIPTRDQIARKKSRIVMIAFLGGPAQYFRLELPYTPSLSARRHRLPSRRRTGLALLGNRAASREWCACGNRGSVSTPRSSVGSRTGARFSLTRSCCLILSTSFRLISRIWVIPSRVRDRGQAAGAFTFATWLARAGHCQLSGPRAPFSAPLGLRAGSKIGEQRSSPTRAAAPPTRRAYHGGLN